MDIKNNSIGYINFLKDKKFIQWQLVPNVSLNAYWEQFIKNNPDCIIGMEQAIDYLKTTGLNKNDLGKDDFNLLFHKIERSLRKQERKIQIRRLIGYAAAICVCMAIGIALFLDSSNEKIITENEFIIGEMLNNEDIQIITNGETIFFHDDVDVTLNEGGSAEISSNTNETSTIQIGKNAFTSLVVPYGKRSTLTLSDGSRIWLNSGSVLEFPSQFSGKKREIRLPSGEMYIDVAFDSEKPFYVQTSHFNVKVHGTKFNVSAYSPSIHSVVLVEGRVGIQVENKDELILKPNEQAISTGLGGTIKTYEVDCEEFVSWKDGFYTFKQTPIEEVLRQIGRYYNIRFDYAQEINLKERTCTGKIYLSDKLENVMKTITLLSNTKYIIEDNQIQIFNNSN